MPESWHTRLARWGFNWFPAYWATGARITYIASDWSEVRISLPLSWLTRNYVGTMFGGSMYGAVDPVYMVMLIKALGPAYEVWDKAATIRFCRPGRERLYATFRLVAEALAALRAEVDRVGKAEREFTVDLVNAAGEVYATCHKVLSIRRRNHAGAVRPVVTMFDRQPTLVGPLLELRPLRSEDWSDLFAVASDPLIWAQHPDADRFKEDVFRQFFTDALNSGGALVAIERASGQIVGSSRYHDFDAARRVVEIGWTFLARRCWGGRYNGDMKRLMLEHAFKAVERVLFIIGPENLRSRRAVEKIGGVYVGVRPDAKGRERVVYELTKAAFATAS